MMVVKRMLLVTVLFCFLFSLLTLDVVAVTWHSSGFGVSVTVEESGNGTVVWHSSGFGVSVTVEESGNGTVVWHSSGFGVSVTVEGYVYGNWSGWWVLTYNSTGLNDSPVFGTPSPANGSTNQPLSLTWSIPISDPEDDTFNWSIECSNGQSNSSNNDVNGTKSLSLSGLSYNTNYTVWVNATDSGSGNWTNASYWFITKQNSAPTVSNVYPNNGSVNIPLQPTCYIQVNDSEEDTMNLYWYENSTGSWVLRQTNSSIGNGTYYWNYSQADTNNTKYWWKIAVNDSFNNITEIYFFTTHPPTGYPVVVTNDSTGVEETNATLWGYLSDDGNETCNVWFEWGTTTSYGNTTVNQTATSGTEFSTFTAIIRPVEDSIPVDSSKYPGTGENAYEDIDDISPDNDSTYIYSTDDGNWDFNYFFFENITSNVTYLDTVTISIYAKVNNSNNNYSWVSARIFNRTNGDPLSSVWNSVLVDNDTNYHYYNHTWNTTYSGESWSKTDINNSEIAVYIYNGDGAYETRVTQVYITLEAGLTNLSPGQIYHYRAVANNSVGTSYGSDKTFLTKPYPPSSLTVSDYNHSHVDLTWLKGSGANKTIIRRSTSGYPSSPQSGTEVYNGTATSFDDTSVTAGSTVYYRAWSYASDGGLQQFSDDNVSVNVTLPPMPPQNVTYDLEVAGTKANITINWTVGVGADKTVVRKASGAPPGSPQSGTLVYNASGNGTVDVNITQAWNYRLWSFNETTGLFSDPVDLDWFAVWLNCFNESTGQPINNWSVFISNEEGTQTYTATNCSNSLILNLSLCPTGSHVAFRFSANGYYPRFYYVDILNTDASYTINAYLPPLITYQPGEEGNQNATVETQLYLITVMTEYDEPVEDAYIVFKHYDPATEEYTNVSYLYTDANGQVNIHLIPNDIYKVVISKAGYVTEVSDYIPSDSIFTHTFVLKAEEETPTPPQVEPEEVVFEGYISNGTLYLNYTDNMNQTNNTQIFVYEINTSTGEITLFGTNTTTYTNVFQVNFTGINASNTYKVVLHYNHTTFGFQTKTLVFKGNYTLITQPSKIDSLLSILVGSSPFGWGNLLMFFFLLAAFFYADQRDAGKILVLIGGIFLFLNVVIGFNTTLMSVAGGVIPVLFIVVGILIMWKESRREVSS